MKLKASFSERRDLRRITAAIHLQAEGAAEFLLDHSQDPASLPPFNAGPLPGRRISPEVYSQQIGSQAVLRVAAEMNPEVAYDHEASLQLTDEVRAARLHDRLPMSLDPVMVVFVPLQD